MKRIFTTLYQKWPEYLLEIIVLIIGIYGAFAVDEWSQNREKRSQEQQVLKQLLVDYETNLNQLDQKLSERQSIIINGLKVLSYIDNSENLNKDSLIAYLGVLVVDPTFDPIENSLINSGNIHLIQNSKLNKLLTNWTSDLVALQEIEKIWTTMTYEQYGPLINKIGITRSAINSFWNDRKHKWILDKEAPTYVPLGKSSAEIPITEILKNKELEGIVTYAVSFNHAANIQSLALRGRIVEILALIDQELK
jgi:hypothetical protein